ncbi:MAG: hypothetical protein HZY74_10495 [Brevundimonas sp.]|nr:MAG: hypothetical protein HZY74_10495 [Brevundimonas sp.]
MASILIVIALLLLAAAIVWLSVRWHEIWQAQVLPGPVAGPVTGPPNRPADAEAAAPASGVVEDPFAHAPPATPVEKGP